jgi:hypothetical protein
MVNGHLFVTPNQTVMSGCIAASRFIGLIMPCFAEPAVHYVPHVETRQAIASDGEIAERERDIEHGLNPVQ